MGLAVVIMAGGRGERFWPSSREDCPKQFLALDGQRTLLQRTASRLEGLCPPEDIWVVTREDYADLVREQLPEVPSHQVLLEPQGRDTAACIALAALHVAHADPDAVMVMLPADHLVLQEDRFRDVVRRGIRLANEGDHLITLGIQPTRPETAYGYIRLGEPLERKDLQACRVAAFVEKPPRETAMSYLLTGGYAWNSGMYIWKASSIKSALTKHLPRLMEALAPVESLIGTSFESDMLQQIYPMIAKTSIDYGVMERADNTLVVPADFGWDDLGTWSALERVIPPDSEGNIISGRVLAIDTKSSILHSSEESRLLVSFGLSDLLVVDTEDVVFVAAKSRASDLKSLVDRMEAEGLQRFLSRP